RGRALARCRKSGSASGIQSVVWHYVPASPRHCRFLYSRRGLSGRDRCGSTLCRSWPFWPWPNSLRLARHSFTGAHHQLSRSGRTGACESKVGGKSLLSALPRLGAAPYGSARNSRHCDRQSGRNHGCLFSDQAGHSARPVTPLEVPPHTGGIVGPIYMPRVNTFLFIGVILLVALFRSSSALA